MTTRIALLALMACNTQAPIRPTPLELSEHAVAQESPDPETVAIEPILDPTVFETSPTEIEAVVEPSVSIEVRSGESLVLLADLSGMRAEDLADFNGIEVKEALLPGQSLQVPLAENDQAWFMEKRDAWYLGKVNRYLARRGGVAGVHEVRVGTGDTAWSIAKMEGGVPLWIVQHYNPEVDLDTLGIGDHLSLPTFGDTVADVTPTTQDNVE